MGVYISDYLCNRKENTIATEYKRHYNSMGITTAQTQTSRHTSLRSAFFSGSNRINRPLERYTLSTPCDKKTMLASKAIDVALNIKLNDDVDNPRYIYDGMNELERNVKRMIDFFIALICLIVFSPLFLVCYILIKREDGGPAIYSQERIGRFGRPFVMYKFRSMKVDAEKDGPQLYSHENDTRMTKVGRFLRDHHLDELPQLYNVLKGDMAFIGPRPERKYYIDKILKHDPRYTCLYQIRPGVTSYATLYNGYADTMEKMLRRLDLDLYYLEHRSWWLDAKILVKTFIYIVSGKVF